MFAKSALAIEGASFSNRTLVGNWWEDRFVANTDMMQSTTAERVFAQEATGSVNYGLQTTKQAFDTSMLENRRTLPKPVPKPSMYHSQPALRAALDTYMPGGEPPAKIAYTMGRNTLKQAPPPLPHSQDTTNQHFYDTLPKQERAAHPEMFGTMDRSKHFVATLHRELKSTQHFTELNADGSAGGKGARGEITRNPGQAGNPYGVSVFADEYSRWGTKLAGKMTLGEVDASKRTTRILPLLTSQ